MSFCLRRLDTDFVDAVLDLEATVFARENKGQTISANERNRRWQSWFITLDQEITYGVFVGDTLGCYANARDKNPGLTPCFCIEAVNTHPEFRQKGLAKAAVAATLRDIEKIPEVRDPYLYVPKKNTAAQSLYQQFGFGIVPDEGGYKSHGVALIKMQREVICYPVNLPAYAR